MGVKHGCCNFLLAFFVFAIHSTLSGYGQSCTPLSTPSKAAVVTYLKRQFDRPDQSVVLVSNVLDVGSTCYRRLTITGLQADGPVIVYLSPDARYLSSALADVTTDPRDARRLAIRTTATTLEQLASPPDAKGPNHPPTLIEFVDYQCPSCKELASWLDGLPVSLKEEVSVRFLNFPLQMHSWAHSAALYAICTGNNPGYLAKLQSALFAKQSSLHEADLQDFIKSAIPYESGDLIACQALPSTTALLNEQLAIADRMRISGTPSLFLDGIPVHPRSKDDLIAMLEAEVKATDTAAVIKQHK